MEFEEKIANKILFSEDGTAIKPGDTFYEVDVHGRTGFLSSNEYEKALGLAEFSTKQRKELAKKGEALPDGSFPIRNCSDASNAIHAIGRANPSDRSKVRAHIKKRVKALGCKGTTFENFK